MRTFEHSDDYVYDVSWNPSNPSIFATVNNEGTMHLFDLTKDVEQPLTQVKINNFAQNKCRWNAEGSAIISGDSAGNVSLLGLGERYRKLENARLDDFETILTQNKDEVWLIMNVVLFKKSIKIQRDFLDSSLCKFRSCNP